MVMGSACEASNRCCLVVVMEEAWKTEGIAYEEAAMNQALVDSFTRHDLTVSLSRTELFD
jgi:hypothetical protein